MNFIDKGKYCITVKRFSISCEVGANIAIDKAGLFIAVSPGRTV